MNWAHLALAWRKESKNDQKVTLKTQCSSNWNCSLRLWYFSFYLASESTCCLGCSLTDALVRLHSQPLFCERRGMSRGVSTDLSYEDLKGLSCLWANEFHLSECKWKGLGRGPHPSTWEQGACSKRPFYAGSFLHIPGTWQSYPVLCFPPILRAVDSAFRLL
jgi:hypothetical protein